MAVSSAAWGTDCDREAVSKTELEKKLKQYKSIASLDARFEQVKTLKDSDLNIKSSGNLRLRSDGKKTEVDWTVKKPAYLNLHITDSSLELSEQQGKAGKPVVESKEIQARIIRPIYAWLTMNSELISEQFEITKCSGAFVLTPKDKDSPIKSMDMLLADDGFVRTVRLAENSGDGLTISFKDTKVTRAAK